MIITVLIFLLVLSILVLAHEFGHFYTARKLGMKVEEFGFGFSPRLFAVYKDKNGKWKTKWGKKKIEDNSDVIYSINAIPIGGFVRIKGLDGEQSKDADGFFAQKIWKRLVVISAGVIMNVILAWVLISIILMIGSPQAMGDQSVSKKLKLSNSRVQISQVMPNSPAEQAGLRALDTILSINSQEAIKSNDVLLFLGESNDFHQIKVQRGEEILEFSVKPEFDEEVGRGLVGIALFDVATVKYPWYLALWEGMKATGEFLWMIVYTFYIVIKNLIIGKPAGVEMAGPVGIATITGQMARLGIVYLIQFTALLSLNLAVINFFPLPALDGGRFIFLIIEWIKGRPVKQKTEAIIHNFGFMLLMLLFVWITLKDVIGLFN